MTSLALFCLLAAAARAARTNRRTYARYVRAGQPASMYPTVLAAKRRAETAKYRLFDAKCELQRAGLAALGKLPMLRRRPSHSLAA